MAIVRSGAILVLFLLAPLAAHAADGDFVWAGSMGGPNTNEVFDIAVDGDGNVYTTGFFAGTADFDPGAGVTNLTAAGGYDFFVQKSDSAGNLAWAARVGGTDFEEGWGITVDSTGDVYITGYFSGTVDFDPGVGNFNLTGTAAGDIFVQKLDTSGNLVWARGMGGTSLDRGISIVVDGAGNVYTTGYFSGTVDFDPGAGTVNLTSAGSYDIFVQKLDASGNFVWARGMGGTSPDLGNGIAVDATGNVYTVGEFWGTTDFDPGASVVNLTSGGSIDIFVSKLDADGDFAWARHMGGTGAERGNGVVLDSAGNVYTTGYFNGTVDFDPGAGTVNLTSAGSNDIFVQKLDASGTLVWARAMGGTNSEASNAIALDGAGNVYTTGGFNGTADFDPGAGTFNLTSAGAGDIFVHKLDTGGNLVWTRRLGGTGGDYGKSIAVDQAGNAHTTGSYQDTVDFDPGAGIFNLTSNGNRNIFVLKLSEAELVPTVNQQSGQQDPTTQLPITFEVTFNEPVDDFDASDVTFGGTATGVVFDVTGSGADYVITVTGVGGAGTVVPTIAAGVCTAVSDGAPNQVSVSTDNSVTYVVEGGGFTTVSSGSGSYDGGNGVAQDSGGNFYVTGFFRGSMDFDPSPSTLTRSSNGEDDVFIVKYDANLNLIWARTFGSGSSDSGSDVVVDSAGNVYLAGFFSGTTDFDPGAGTVSRGTNGSYDVFVMKLDTNGNFVWVQTAGSTLDDYGVGIALDPSGNVWSCGYFRNSIDMDPGAGTVTLSSSGVFDPYLWALDANGGLVYAGSVGGSGYDTAAKVHCDASGNVYLCGYFVGTADLNPSAGTANFNSAGGNDAYVLKLDSSRTFAWAVRTGAAGNDTAADVKTGPGGLVHVTGSFSGTVDFDPGAGTFDQSSAGSEDGFVQTLDANGAFVTALRFGGTNIEFPTSLMLDAAGNRYVAGYFDGSTDLDPGPGVQSRSSNGTQDIFVAKLDASGAFVWGYTYGGASEDRANDVLVATSGNTYHTGWFQGTVDFDPSAGTDARSSNGLYDYYFARIDSSQPDAISIVPGTVGPTNGDSVSFTVAFDEDVQNFSDAADLVVSHTGTSSSGATITGGPSVYSVDLTGISGNGSFTLAVNTSSDVQDLASNALASSVTSAAVSIDNMPPGVDIGAPTGSPVNSGGTATFPITVTGSDSVSLVSGNVTINHSGTAGGSVSVLDGATTSPAVEVTGVTGDGSYTIGIAAGIASDVAGNNSPASGPSAAVTVDNTDPVFSNVVATPAEASDGDTVTITFDSSETLPVDPDVTVNGNPASPGAKAALTYAYTVLPTDPLGPAMIEISGMDSAGNAALLSNNTALTIVPAAPELPVAAWPLGLALAAAGGLALRRKIRK
ncbi:MAG: hypothetical protein GC168_00075 [Candidatus Hydrogenedens sp.]|nr:hypothetical protein [Candidatus Hydrogenedens sp.]